VNEEYHAICNLPPEMTPSYESFLTKVVPEDKGDYGHAVRAAISTQDEIDAGWRAVALETLLMRDAPASIQEMKPLRSDGSELWVLLNCRPSFEGKDDVGSLVMIADFTERKSLQDEVQANIQ
jgi:hypothetical protein